MQETGYFFKRSGIECERIDLAEGIVFEINNCMNHRVANSGPGDRIHVVIDAVEGIRGHTVLDVGAVCEYRMGAVSC